MTASSRLSTLGKKAELLDDLGIQLNEAIRDYKIYAESTIGFLEQRIHDLERHSSLLGLNVPELRDALCNDMAAATKEWCPKILATLGSGPWDAAEFDAFLIARQFDPVEAPHEDITGVIVGANDWDEGTLAKQIFDRDSSLRIYTQEIFVVGLILGDDPYKILSQEAIEEIAKNHPAIRFILDNNFVWPSWPENESLDVDSEDWDDASGLNQESVFMRMGYNARGDGPNPKERRAVLKEIFESRELPDLESDDQVRRWGAAYSAQRLYAMYRFLKWLIDFQGSHHVDAKAKWMSDLDWLKINLYKPEMHFSWSGQIEKQSSTTRVTNKVINAAFMNAFQPSATLAEIVGNEPLPRTEVVAKLWSYVKKHRLQDSVNKRMINADSKLRRLFGKDQVSMFEMAGLLGKHLK